MGATDIHHKERSHAVLSASGAERWINCTPSARLSEQYGQDTDTEAAREGTFAHEFSELRISYTLGWIDESEYIKSRGDMVASGYYQGDQDKFDEMAEYVERYVSAVTRAAQLASLMDSRSVVLLEERLDYSHVVPEGFGTGDAVIVSPLSIEVIDLKFGRGKVSPTMNPQLLLYALGALRKHSEQFPDIQQVTVTIAQPRIGNVASFGLTKDALLEWGESVRPIAAQAFEGKGEFSTGDWCTFCPVRGRCRAIAEKGLEAARRDFEDARLLNDKEIADVVRNAGAIRSWIVAVEDYALETLKSGKTLPGLSLATKPGNRKWLDDQEVAKALIAAGIDRSLIYKAAPLKGIGDIEKICKKTGKDFAETVGSYVTRAPESTTIEY